MEKFFTFLCFLLFQKLSCFPYYKLPHSINLLNGNIFIIHSKGIVIYDSSFEKVIKNVLSDNNLLSENDVDALSQIEIARFSERDNGLIICVIYKKFYIFDWEGTKLYQSPNNETSLNGKYYTLVPIRKNLNEYIYMIGFIGNAQEINLIFFKYKDASNEIINELFYIKMIFSLIVKIQNLFMNMD